MQKSLFLFLIFLSCAFSEVISLPVSQKVLDSGIKIIDIRTKSEWEQTGIVKGAIPITFFDEKGNYNISKFLSKLNSYIKKGEKFAIICRTGHRTGVVSKFLGDKGYKVVNLEGGILSLLKQGYKPVRYHNSDN